MIDDPALQGLETLLTEGRHSLKLPLSQRAAAALLLMPKMVEYLGRVCLYHPELRDTRAEISTTLHKLREAVTKAQRMHPEVTYNNAEVAKALLRAERLVDRVQRLIFGEPS